MRLFEPITVRGMTLKNRVVMPPMHVGLGYRGHRAVAYFVERARGGAAAVTLPLTYVDVLSNEVAWGRPGAVAEFVASLRPLIDAVHGAGAKIGIQLGHMNRLPAGLTPDDKSGEPVAPSPRKAGEVPPTSLRASEMARELTIPEIEQIVTRFGIAAGNAKKAGFDYVEFHSAHAYLPSQFISPLRNRRTDRYGGDLTGRMRFGRECTAAMRAAIGDFPLFARVAVEERSPRGLTVEDGVKYARAIQDAGADVLSVSLGDTVPVSIPGPENPMGTFAGLAARVKKVASVPVMAVGRINRPEVAESILADGQADLIAIGRQLIADPHWVAKVQAGRAEDITPCISCNKCLQSAPGQTLHCSVNVAAGNEEEARIQPAAQAKKVIVVGGGPGGMEAAWVAALRGHKVTLYEESNKLGGQLDLASRAPGKSVIADLSAYLERQVQKSGAKVRLNSRATASAIVRARPDAVIVATGATPTTPDIPGVDGPNVVSAEDVLSGRKETGRRVAIIGGELVASDVAEFLAEKGKQITMLRRGPEMMARVVRKDLHVYAVAKLAARGVNMLTGVRYREITPAGVTYLDGEGKLHTVAADTVIIATGASPESRLKKALEGRVAAVHTIGDCVQPRSILDAIHEGARVAREI